MIWKIQEKKPRGKLVVKLQDIGSSPHEYKMQWKGVDLLNMEAVGTSDPFLKIFKKVNMSTTGGGWIKVAETNFVFRNLNPDWKEYTVPADKFCNSNFKTQMKIMCLDWESMKQHQYIGEADFTMEEIILQKKRKFELYNFMEEKYAGFLELTNFSIQAII